MEKGRDISCPDRDELIKFRWGPELLTPDERVGIEKHLDECPLCKEELLSMEEFFGGEEIPDAVPAAGYYREPSGVEALTDLISRFPKPVSGRFSVRKLGNMFSGFGDSLKKLFELNPADIPVPGLSALRSHLDTEQYSSDSEVMRSCLAQAQYALAGGRFTEAAERFEECTANPPPGMDIRELYFTIGYSYLQAGRVQTAISYLRRSIDEEADPIYYWTMIRALLEIGAFTDAMAFLKVLAGMDSEYSDKAADILDTLRES